jgi:hypothetical protein
MFRDHGIGDAARDETPTEPAPAVHCYHVPKFPPDPKLPQVEEPVTDRAERAKRERPSGIYSSEPLLTFHPAPILRHVYAAVSSGRKQCG